MYDIEIYTLCSHTHTFILHSHSQHQKIGDEVYYPHLCAGSFGWADDSTMLLTLGKLIEQQVNTLKLDIAFLCLQ